MDSASLKEASQLCLRGCCPYPIILNVPEQDQAKSKNKSTSAVCRHNFATTTASSVFPDTNFTNHESIPSLEESYVQFIKSYPKYSETARIDRIRARDYSQLSLSKHVCFDYIGVGLFSQSQVESENTSALIPVHMESHVAPQQPDSPLFSVTYKSVNLKTELLHGDEGSELQSGIKKRIMDFLNICPNDYSMVFTANRSSAFKLVAESYPFQSSRKLLTVYDHESDALDAMINMSEKKGARIMAAEFKWPRLRIHSAKLSKMIMKKKRNKKKKIRGLFVFPLQSRMTGVSNSYQWMTMAQENGWHVILDACALGPKDMDSFGLSLFQPDFLVCSFYKVFGENPTGFGCLFVKKSVVPILEDSIGAGIVSIIPAKKNLFSFPEDSSGTDTELAQITRLETSDRHEKKSSLTEESSELSEKVEIEKQVVSFHQRNGKHENGSLIIECRCLDHVDSLGLMVISSRGRYLINWLITALMKLQHPNRLDNFPLVIIYGPKVKFERGPALAFNIYDWKGEKVEPVLVQKLADRNNISVGHGFLHHIWFPEKFEELKQRIIEKNTKQVEKGIKNGKGEQGIAVVTIALTFLANFEDVYKLWAFVAQFLDADFVEKERWRYTALNQKTVEV